MAPQQELISLVNAIIDNIQQTHQTKTDLELAQLLGISKQTLANWRAGVKLGKSTRILLPLASSVRPIKITTSERLRRRRGRPSRVAARS